MTSFALPLPNVRRFVLEKEGLNRGAYEEMKIICITFVTQYMPCVWLVLNPHLVAHLLVI